MSHWVLGTLNAFIYCVIFMVAVVVCGLLYVAFKWLCGPEEESETNENYVPNGNTVTNANLNNFSPSAPRTNIEPTRFEHIPLMTRPDIRSSPSTQRTYPIDAASSRIDAAPPYPISPNMPMPQRYSPKPSAPEPRNPTDLPPTYEQAVGPELPQPAYNPQYSHN